MKSVIALLCIVSLGGCGSTAPIKTSEQFCDLKSKTVSVKDKTGRVVDEESIDVMVCNDNKVDRLFHAKSGMARDCGEYKYVMTLNGRPVERTGYACQKYNGTWEVVPHPSMYQ